LKAFVQAATVAHQLGDFDLILGLKFLDNSWRTNAWACGRLSNERRTNAQFSRPGEPDWALGRRLQIAFQARADSRAPDTFLKKIFTNK
jgi:hypothetical protein